MLFSSHFREKPSSRGQAALEFLSTYGFAFIALLLAIGAITYFGIFNPNTLRAQDCKFPDGLSCYDFILSNADPGLAEPPLAAGNAPYLRMVLINGYGVNITPNAITILEEHDGQQRVCGVEPGNWADGANKTVWCPLQPSLFVSSQRYQAVVTFNFTQTSGMYIHSVKGSVSVIAQ